MDEACLCKYAHAFEDVHHFYLSVFFYKVFFDGALFFELFLYGADVACCPGDVFACLCEVVVEVGFHDFFEELVYGDFAFDVADECFSAGEAYAVGVACEWGAASLCGGDLFSFCGGVGELLELA